MPLSAVILEKQSIATDHFNAWIQSCRQVFGKHNIADTETDYLILQYRRSESAIIEQIILLETACGVELDNALLYIKYLQYDSVTRYLDLICYLGDKFNWIGIDKSEQQVMVDTLNSALHDLADTIRAQYPNYPIPPVAIIQAVRDKRLNAPIKKHDGEWK